MIVPKGVDLATVSREELVSAYVRDGFSREEAEALATLLLNPPAGDPPTV